MSQAKQRGEYRRTFGSGNLVQIWAIGFIMLAFGLWEQSPDWAIASGIAGVVVFWMGMKRSRR